LHNLTELRIFSSRNRGSKLAALLVVIAALVDFVVIVNYLLSDYFVVTTVL